MNNMKNQIEYKAIGLMSGSSLDGLDICFVSFWQAENQWKYKILETETVLYNENWKSKLAFAHQLDASALKQLDIEYGFYLGEETNKFIENKSIDKNSIDFISSHGHTIFHQPQKKITLQIGHGAAILDKTKKTVICDFRTQDVIFGGQGAPLVPIGDKLLFHSFDSCLNLGGFSNISYKNEDLMVAFDICPVNAVLNHLSQKYFDKEFDKYGEIAKSGTVIQNLLSELNILAYYRHKPPKSLGIEWVEEHIYPLLNEYKDKKDLLATYTEHIAVQIAAVLNSFESKTVLVTGGGANNKYLIERIKFYTNATLELPQKELINYKEALIFAFLGLLKIQNKVNILSSVTGVAFDHSSGVIYHSIN